MFVYMYFAGCVHGTDKEQTNVCMYCMYVCMYTFSMFVVHFKHGVCYNLVSYFFFFAVNCRNSELEIGLGC